MDAALLLGLLLVGAALAVQQRRRQGVQSVGALEVLSRRQLGRDAWMAVVRVDDGQGGRTLVLAGGAGAPRLLAELDGPAPAAFGALLDLSAPSPSPAAEVA
jgi:hypothetical protein